MSARQFKGDRLVIATHNPGKVPEIAALLQGRVANFVTAGELGLAEPNETEITFVGNAKLKAFAAATASGLPALADDSGVEVTALGGAPGVYTARWAGPTKDFNMAMKRVHCELGDAADRSAAFVCVLALAWPDGHVETAEGRLEGEIVWPMRGTNGFGYDPVFVPKGETRTFAEMETVEKKAISHRTRAFENLVQLCFW